MKKKEKSFYFNHISVVTNDDATCDKYAKHYSFQWKKKDAMILCICFDAMSWRYYSMRFYDFAIL